MIDNATISSVMLPTYRVARRVLPILSGANGSTITLMMRSIYLNSGTPDEPVRWSKPDEWIEDILEGEQGQLAKRIWEESEKSINPRYLKGSFLFINKHRLVERDALGKIIITERGRLFLHEDLVTLAAIDKAEGILTILELMTSGEIGRRSLGEAWEGFALGHSSYRSSYVIKGMLRDRLSNLVERGLIKRSQSHIEVTVEGTQYLSRALDK